MSPGLCVCKDAEPAEWSKYHCSRCGELLQSRDLLKAQEAATDE